MATIWPPGHDDGDEQDVDRQEHAVAGAEVGGVVPGRVQGLDLRNGREQAPRDCRGVAAEVGHLLGQGGLLEDGGDRGRHGAVGVALLRDEEPRALVGQVEDHVGPRLAGTVADAQGRAGGRARKADDADGPALGVLDLRQVGGDGARRGRVRGDDAQAVGIVVAPAEAGVDEDSTDGGDEGGPFEQLGAQLAAGHQTDLGAAGHARVGCLLGGRHGSGLLLGRDGQVGGCGEGLAEDLGERTAHRPQLAQAAQVLGRPEQSLLVGPAGHEREAGARLRGSPADVEAGHAGEHGPGRFLRGVGGAGDVDDGAPPGLGAGLEALGGALGDQAPGADDGDPIAQVLDDVELVGGEEGRYPGLGPLAQDLAHDVDRHRVESGEGLVEDEQLGGADEGGRQLDALLVAPAQLLDIVAASLLDAQTLGPLVAGPTG